MTYNVKKPKIVAEIGCCHLGSVERAKDLIHLAKLCDADYVKFQKRNPDESVPEQIKNKPHPNKIFAYGKTYLEHRKNLELSIDDHIELKRYCDELKIGYAASVWDLTSASEIVSLNPDFIKIPSACNQHWKMLDYLRDEYAGDLHLSTGMTTHPEMNKLAFWITGNKVKERIVLYHCTSKYPCEFEDLHLLEIDKLNRRYKQSPIRLGFSNHGKGIATDIAAYVLGAEWIERHFIDDRLVRHTDAAASLEPSGLSKLVRDLQATHSALTFRPNKLDEKEQEQRDKLKVLSDE